MSASYLTSHIPSLRSLGLCDRVIYLTLVCSTDLPLSPSPSVLFPLAPFPCCPLFLFLSNPLLHTSLPPLPLSPSLCPCLPILSHFLHSAYFHLPVCHLPLLPSLSCISSSPPSLPSLILPSSFPPSLSSHSPSLSIHPIEINDGFITH